MQKTLANTDSIYCLDSTNSNQTGVFLGPTDDAIIQQLIAAATDGVLKLRLNYANLFRNAVEHFAPAKSFHSRNQGGIWTLDRSWIGDALDSLDAAFKGESDTTFFAGINAQPHSRTYLTGLAALKRETDSSAKLDLRKYLFAGDTVSIELVSPNLASLVVCVGECQTILHSPILGPKTIVQFAELHSLDEAPLQRIFYGAPGTGKSYQTDKVAKGFDHTIRVTFHPDSDYSAFVGTYKPKMIRPMSVYGSGELIVKLNEIKRSGVSYPCQKFGAQYWNSLKDLDAPAIKTIVTTCGFTDSMTVEVQKGIAVGQELLNHDSEGKIVYAFVPQAFTKAYELAWRKMAERKEDEDPAPQFLVIEEINRGNCAQIFGDLFQLLDRDDAGYSKYPVDPDTDLAKYLADAFKDLAVPDARVRNGEVLILPPNLYIWATMNTSDQSLFPMDSAFKRRWDWKYVPITEHKEENYKIEIDGTIYDWWKFLKAINDRIFGATDSEDKKLGYFFVKAEKKDGRNVIDAERFLNKVVFYLWNDVFKNSEPEKAFKFDRPDKKENIATFQDFFNEETGVRDDAMLKAFLKGLEVEPEDPKSNESTIAASTATGAAEGASKLAAPEASPAPAPVTEAASTPDATEANEAGTANA